MSKLLLLLNIFLAAVDVATLAVAVVIIAIVIQSNRLLSLQLLT